MVELHEGATLALGIFSKVRVVTDIRAPVLKPVVCWDCIY